MQIKQLAIFVILLILSSITAYTPAAANHLVGGVVSYECLSPGEYRVTFKLYRDCNSTVALESEAASIYTQGTFDLVVDTLDLLIAPEDITFLPPDTDNICPESIPDVCLELGIYEVDVSLPNIPEGYIIVFQRCCRNNTILNIDEPGTVGSTFIAEIPGSLDPAECVNNSPSFVGDPPQIICANSAFVFDNSATDADGDDLVYELCAPLAGASTQIPNPVPCPPPPYDDVPWIPGFDTNNQIPSEPAMSIDPDTGELFLFPSETGQYVVGICVSEYRDGVLLGTVRRDFQFNVTECQSLAPAVSVGSLAGEVEYFTDDTVRGCSPLTVAFTNISTGAASYYWEFGNDAPPTNEENPLTPIIYADTGVYEAFMVAEDSDCNLADTLKLVIDVLEPEVVIAGMDIVFPADCTGLDFAFNNTSTIGSNADQFTYTWDFGDGNQIDQENTTHSYVLPGAYEVKLIINGPEPCFTTDTVSQFINAGGLDVTADFTIPTVVCAPHDLELVANSPANSYRWETGDGTSLSGVTTTHNYANEGSFDIQLIVTDPSACNEADTLVQSLQVYETPTAAFSTTTDSPEIFAMLTLNSEYSSAPDNFTFSWDFGDGTTADTPTTEIAYSEIGEKTICLTVDLEGTDCTDTQCQTVNVSSDVAIEIPTAFSPNEDGVNDVLMIRGKGFGTIDFVIFDRFGREVFATQDPTVGWDGRLDEEYQEMDVFVYVLKAVMYDGTVIDRSGNITMVK